MREKETAATVARTARATQATRPHTATAPADDGPPDELLLGRYRLGRRLGSGAFGTVWVARDERLERDVAVKVLPRRRVEGSRFEREARAAARLQHPAIVTLFEAAVDDDGAYLVSELVRGKTLDALLDGGHLSDQAVVQIAICLADALDHAHAEGVVHRDVKPSNILVPARPTGSGDAAKLTDFGVARVVGGDTLTRTGDVIGTAAYMAPEQAEGREVGPEADLYSLALVLYEGLTGVNPIAAHLRANRARRLGTYLPPLRRQRRDLPRELGAAIDLALRPRARERGTLTELRASLVSSLSVLSDAEGVVEPAHPLGALTLGRSSGPDELGPEWAPHGHEPPDDRGRRGHWLAGWIGARGWTVIGAVALVALGVVGLAGAWPGLIGVTVRRWWVRGIAGAAGFAWIAVASAVGQRDLYWRAQRIDPHVLRAAGIAAGIWAASAVLGGTLARSGRAPRAALVLVVALSAATAAAVAQARVPGLRGSILGAVVAAAILAAPPLLALLRGRRRPGDAVA